MSFRLLAAAALTLQLLGNLPALAQGTKDVLRSEEIMPTLSDPSLSSPVSDDKPRLTLTSQQDGTNIVGRIGLQKDDWQWSLKLQAPVATGQEETQFANLDGLSSGTVATLGFTKTIWTITESKIIDTCEAFNRTLPLRTPIDIPGGQCNLDSLQNSHDEMQKKLAADAQRAAETAVCEEFNKAGRGLLVSDDTVLEGLPPGQAEKCATSALKAKGKEWEDKLASKLGEILRKACEEHNQSLPEGRIDIGGGGCRYLALKAKGPQWAAKAKEDVGFHAPMFFSLNLSTRRDTFKYADEHTLQQLKTTKDGFAGVASFGILSRGTYYALNVRSERLYKGATAANICAPIPGTGGLTCSMLAPTGPTQADRQIYQIELRRLLFGHFGVNPQISYEAKQKVEGYELLLYFLQDDKKGLNGGLDLGYRSDDQKFTARVFIGVAFDLIPAI